MCISGCDSDSREKAQKQNASRKKPITRKQRCDDFIDYCLSTMTEDEAKQLFNKFASEDKIPFDYPVDCCYSRAHLMCMHIEYKGFICEKQFVFDSEWVYGNSSQNMDLRPKTQAGQPMTFPNENGNEQQVKWSYHVAPIVTILNNEGDEKHLIIDPSIASQPVTVDEWKNIMGIPKDRNGNYIGIEEIKTESRRYFQHPFNNSDYKIDLGGQDSKIEIESHKYQRDLNLNAAKK